MCRSVWLSGEVGGCLGWGLAGQLLVETQRLTAVQAGVAKLGQVLDVGYKTEINDLCGSMKVACFRVLCVCDGKA